MNTVIATTTFSPIPDVRAYLALEMAKMAAALGLTVVAVDGGSCQELRSELANHGAILFNEEYRGMGPSRRQAMREAWKIAGPLGPVLWMEPEKWPLIGQIFLMETMMQETGADIVVPARKSLESYPKIQRVVEKLGNMYFAEVTGRELDTWFGPRLIGPKAIPFFLNYEGEYGDEWDATFIPVIQAIKDGLKVVGCEVDYTHPAEQTKAEEANPGMDLKRLDQLGNLAPSFYAEGRRLGLIE